MIEVRIRQESDSESLRLGEIPFDKLDTVIPTIKEWGITTPSSDYPEMFGQFVYGEISAYFEVILADGES